MFAILRLVRFHYDVIDASVVSFQGISPHVSPFVELRDMGGLLGQAGYALTTVVSI